MKIVFPHIEKTAGTSFRGYLYRMFREAEIFWFGSMNEPFPEQEFFFYGGHRAAHTYDAAIDDSILISIIREPVARVISLHRYLCMQIQSRRKPERVDPYVESGFVESSVEQSIEQCDDFRRRVSNRQTMMLSGQDPSLRADDRGLAEESLRYLRNRPSIVGVQDHTDKFLQHLNDLWGWSTTLPKQNVSNDFVEGTANYDDPRELAAIREVCDQDIKLYESVREHECFCAVTKQQASLVPMPEFINPDALQNIRLYKLGSQELQVSRDERESGNKYTVDLRLENLSASPFRVPGHITLNASYHVKDPDGQLVIYNGIRTPFPRRTVQPGDAVEFSIQIQLPEARGKYLIEPALVAEHVTWIDQGNGADTGVFLLELP